MRCDGDTDHGDWILDGRIGDVAVTLSSRKLSYHLQVHRYVTIVSRSMNHDGEWVGQNKFAGAIDFEGLKKRYKI